MKAAVVTGFDRPLEIQERPVPRPGPGQVLIRIEASGLCHTDIHAARGDWPVKPTPPFVPGHEGVGTIETVGAGVTERVVGERVALAWLGHACGSCDHCVSGWDTLCEQQQNTGYPVDGAFADYAVADATYVVPVPDSVSSFDAAPLSCAGVTFEQAFASLRRGGRLVCVALPPEGEGVLRVPIFETVLKGISIIGSIVGTRQDLREVFRLHELGRTTVMAEARELDEVNECIEEVLAGRTDARIVFET